MLPFAPFSLETPDTWATAHDLLADPGARLVAGGTDLLPSMKHRIFRPGVLVSMRRLPGLRTVEETADGGLTIGAGLTLRELSRLAPVRARYPALAAACATVATPTIQATATLGGNIMLDTRCVYYNQPEGWRAGIGGCLKCDGSVCHVAPKGKGCYAAHSADTVPVLWLHGARVVLASADGERTLPMAEMYQDDGIAWLAVRPGEVLTRVLLPAPAATVLHRKARTRAAIDYGYLLVAASRGPEGYRAVVSAVGPRPIEVSGDTPERLAEAAYATVQPLGTHLQPATWRKKMVRVEVRRAAELL
ncbi:MAG: FAD binding domain-containing protein [Pseudomonadota bacterium]|nr:FAD binding domain-containing protein [Pseudomonadota bacterium]